MKEYECESDGEGAGDVWTVEAYVGFVAVAAPNDMLEFEPYELVLRPAPVDRVLQVESITWFLFQDRGLSYDAYGLDGLGDGEDWPIGSVGGDMRIVGWRERGSGRGGFGCGAYGSDSGIGSGNSWQLEGEDR